MNTLEHFREKTPKHGPCALRRFRIACKQALKWCIGRRARRLAPLTDFSGEPVHRLVQNDAKGSRKEKVVERRRKKDIKPANVSILVSHSHRSKA